jgi:hypothetical protein
MRRRNMLLEQERPETNKRATIYGESLAAKR